MSDSLNALLMTQPHSAGALTAPVVANPLGAMSAGTQLATQQTELRQKQFDLQQAQLLPAYQAMRQTWLTNPNPSDDDVKAALAQSARIGSANVVDGLVQNYADWRARGGTPGDFMRAYAMGGMSPERQGELVGPQRVSIQTAEGTVLGAVGGAWGPNAGQLVGGTDFIQKGLSPTERMQPYTVMGPNGPITVPTGDAYGGGGGGGAGPAAGGGGGGGAGAVIARDPRYASAGEQGNNPGNLMVATGGNLPAGATGVIPLDGGRQVAAFPDAATGVAANADNLNAYATQHGITTVADATNRWVNGPNAKPGSGPDLTSYNAAISKALGVGPNDKIDLTNPAVQRAFILAQQPFETGGKTPWLTPAAVDAGIALSQQRRGGGGGGPQPAPYQVASNAPTAPPAAPGGAGGNVQRARVFSPTGQLIDQGGGGGGTLAGGFTLPAPGEIDTQTANRTQFLQDQQAAPALVTRMQNMQHAYDALTMLQSSTGKGAAGIQNLRSWAQTLGIAPQGAVDEATLMDLVGKYTTRGMLDAAGGPSTDMGKQLQQEANAGTLLTKPANLAILRNDLGKAMQSYAAVQTQDPTTGGAGYLQRRSDIASTTDPRGFMWSFYSKSEQDKILAEVKGTPADAQLHRAIGMTLLNPKLQVPGVRPPPPAPQ